MKILFLFAVACLLGLNAIAQKFYVEKAEGGSEQVIVNRMLEKGYHLTFKEDSADYIIKPNIKTMTLGRARGGLLIINAKSGEIVTKTKEVLGTTKLANGYDNPVSAVLKKISKKYLFDTLSTLVK